ncbi:heat-inducible transcriptional repressor HrcA [Desulfovermiculus halophilus]|uniref:heat-inducible transcriptional repressor HrcA n=1 Tax=Desulfovermiculus halophilus TaxID=339722 RepID=UPI0004802794|nr:heat-inducible transcriptional repressor HrcA [Desulfovermiculus halophilus]
MTLTAREIEVVRIIVQAYIEHAAPVGSRYVAKQSTLKLSAASMRNIMADLTEKGYLHQPYTSAGRVPTDKAFRFYVDTVLSPALLPENTQQDIKEALGQAGLEFSNILEHASKLISAQSSQVGVAVAPKRSMIRLKRIDLVLVRTGLVMAIAIFNGGVVHNKLLPVEPKVTADDLVKYANYLNEKFQDRTIEEIKKDILQEMEQAENRFNALYAKALSLARDAFANNNDREVFLDGTLNVLDHLEGKDVSSMRDLLEFLEHRSSLLELVDKLASNEGLIVTFGTEFYGPELGQWGLISSPYQVQGQKLGVVGTIGPIHMDYSRLMPMVDTIAKMLSDLLESRFA